MTKGFVFHLLAVLFAINASAQTNLIPEFSSRPYVVTAEKTLKDVERADAKVDFKVKGMGYGGSEIYYTTFSAKSSSRFPQSNLPKFMIKVDGGVDPAEVIMLSIGEVKKDKRRFLQSDMAMMGSARDVSSTYVKVEFKKIGDGVYEIILPADINSGEYAFIAIANTGGGPLSMYGTTVKISCFGID